MKPRGVGPGSVNEFEPPPSEEPLASPENRGVAPIGVDQTHARTDGFERSTQFRTDLFDLPLRRSKPGLPGLDDDNGLHSGVNSLLDHFAVQGLKSDPGFKALPQEVQDKMLAAVKAAPRPLAKTFQDLANDPSFRALPASTQAIAVEQLAKHPRDAAATNTIRGLIGTPGFAALNTDEKDRLLRLVGGTNKFISVPERQALANLTASAAFVAANPAGQAQMLRDLLKNQAATPQLAAENGGALSRASYSVSAGTDVAEHGFRSGKAEGVTYDVKIGDQTVKVTMPKNPPAGSNLPSIDDVAKSLAALPPASLALVKEVVVNPGQNPDDAYWEKKYAMPGFRSYMTAGKEGIVNIYPTTSAQSQTILEMSMIHETGHVLSNSNWGDSLDDKRWQGWKDAVAKDGVVPSAYGKSSLKEDFAETLVIYMNVKGTPREAEMRALMPERFKIIDQLVG
jgi:hypothetical protein